MHFGCSGFALVDADGDVDLDVVFGEQSGPLHFFEHRSRRVLGRPVRKVPSEKCKKGSEVHGCKCLQVSVPTTWRSHRQGIQKLLIWA